ncbi:MAG TPA: hypothetical protein VM390_00050 [Acidimicrobiales bacterium]|nr:hypothetical protein [Acidimicrobiales bacterium]
MAYTRNHAKALLTATEYELFTASLDDRIGEMSPAQLRRAITRCRQARDKYRDLYKRQSLATADRARSRGAASTANERTGKKATIFAEALRRFEGRLERVEAAETRARRDEVLQRAAGRAGRAGPPANRAERRAAGGRGKAQAGGFMSPSAEAENRSTVVGPTAKSISAHRSAVGRRTQAKRDSRPR